MMQSRTVRYVAASWLALTQACYSFVPLVEGTQPAPGQRVRVMLNQQGTTELARYLGPRVKVAEGVFSVSQQGS
ncbi:MAG TPA: hypothetical protein VFT47_04355, partial [Vicinamibacterales bacterium]|nr:hypothetical protein [Vicinamibacterales bacterium]